MSPAPQDRAATAPEDAVYMPKWVLLLPVVAVVAMLVKEYPALIRYIKIERM